MTPERKAWWDSLPREERKIRLDIIFIRMEMRSAKKILNEKISNALRRNEKNNIKYYKRLLRTLRKQIAMRPQVVPFSDVLTRQPKLKCPCCSHRFILYTPYCRVCGQRLRWK